MQNVPLSRTATVPVAARQTIASTALTQNHAATSFTPVTGSGATGILSYVVSPTLPTGLTYSASTVPITGTPTVTSSGYDAVRHFNVAMWDALRVRLKTIQERIGQRSRRRRPCLTDTPLMERYLPTLQGSPITHMLYS
jgi:hypothetical protein